MNVLMIFYIVGAFIAGVILTGFILKKSKSGSDSECHISALETENTELKNRLSTVDAKYREDSLGLSRKIEEVKAKYEILLEEANAQCEKLDQQLKCAMEGKLDDVVKERLTETDKLKKKIRDLEEELEENEDDISDLKKKLKTKDSDIVDLQYDLGKEQKVAKELREDLNSAKQALEDKMEELKLKMGSLDFIQEILSAKEISTADTNKLYKNINFFESFVKGQFTDLSSYLHTTYTDLLWNNIEGKQGFEAKKKYFFNGFEQWASTKRKSWLDGKTTIAFVGEFSAGKTSIVNRILSQDDPNIPQLPVSTKATTAIPTYIAGGSAVSYSFISGDAKRKIILEETFKKVSKDILDQVKGVSSLIKYFIMTYENPNLDGLSILDTPGFNSNDSEDRDRTIEVINECDALFWVFDVNAGTVNRSSISIIKEKLNKPLYVVINKVDTKSELDVQKVEDLIKKTFSNAGLHVQQFIRFSAKAPLTSIMNPIKAVKKIASRGTFVGDVKEDLEHLLKYFENKVEKSRSDYYRIYRESENITREFCDCLEKLQGDCETACDIPQWVKHTFSKDRFEMTDSEGEYLKSLLNQIATDEIKTLKSNFNVGIQKAEKVQQKWSEKKDLEVARQKVKDCYEQYKKVSKNI